MNGKKRLFLFLGSSVTYGFANGGVSFVEYVEEALGIPCVKEAVNGTTLADTGSDSYVSRLHALKLEGVTHLIVQLSTNDVVRGVPRGCLSPSRNKDAFDLSPMRKKGGTAPLRFIPIPTSEEESTGSLLTSFIGSRKSGERVFWTFIPSGA